VCDVGGGGWLKMGVEVGLCLGEAGERSLGFAGVKCWVGGVRLWWLG
jgi:hypothetical protein